VREAGRRSSSTFSVCRAFALATAKEVIPAPRGPGRPPGSENLLTKRWRNYLLLNYPSPLEGLVAVAALGVEDISKSLRCSLLEAMNIKSRCMEYATVYLYPRLQATLYRNEGDPAGGSASRGWF
jgi:hypothetical protein